MAITLPSTKADRVVERVARRDFIPAGGKLTATEEKITFNRDELGVSPQFIPAEDSVPTAPLGKAEEQMRAAAEAVKLRNTETAIAEESGDIQAGRIERLKGLNSGDAIMFVVSLSDGERALYLEAEKSGKNRTSVLSYFGSK